MGLDLVVEGCPKPGHEREWRHLLERSFADEDLSEEELTRFQEIIIPGHERLGAPRVGQDDAANKWIVQRQSAKTPEEIAKVLKDFNGYYVVSLVKCDGVPQYSNGGMYDGVDETSFRGSFFHDCTGVLRKDLLNEAGAHKFPEEAVAYGQALLLAAEATGTGQVPKSGFLSRLGLKKVSSPHVTIAEQLDIVRSAGRWFIFWGERGHAIRAYF